MDCLWLKTTFHSLGGRIYGESNKKKADIEDITKVHDLLAETGINYIFIKTLGPPRAPADIDVLIEDEREIWVAEEILREKGYKTMWGALDHPRKIACHKNGECRIDLYEDISWGTLLFLKNVPKRDMVVEGVTYPVPAFEEDFLIFCSHMLIDKMRIYYEEEVYLSQLFSCLNWERTKERAGEFGWKRGLEMLFNKMRKNGFPPKESHSPTKIRDLMLFTLSEKILYDVKIEGILIGSKRLYNYALTKSSILRSLEEKRKNLKLSPKTLIG